MQVSVSQDRNLYTGGSDIPIIMGISPFKKRYDLLLEKAGLQENTFEGNCYTEYGNVMEEKIRNYVNRLFKTKYVEDKYITGDVRCHYDGINEDSILEVKTTSQVHENVNDYMVYLVQLLFYMHYSGRNKGRLAVYHRPDDFNEEFDPDRLQIFEIERKDYEELIQNILDQVDQFRKDLERIKENPLLTEDDLMPVDVKTLSEKLEKLENKLIEYDEINNQYEDVKKKLYDAMDKHGIKSWELNSGTKITKVNPTLGSTKIVDQFNEKKFKEENKDLYNKYVEKVEKTTSGRAGYLKISLKNKEVE